MNVLKKVAKKVENSKIVKNPKFLVIGLILAGMTAYENNKTYRMRLKGAKK